MKIRERMGEDAMGSLLLRGYAPLMVIVITLALLVLLVPSKGPTERAVQANNSNETETTTQSGPTDVSTSVDPSTPVATTPAGGSGTKPGGQGQPVGGNGNGGSAQPPGAVPGGTATVAGDCEGGARQTKEPYSPPCIKFSGENGGATSPGVSGDTIKVAIREGNLPSLYAVAGQVAEKANIKDTNEDIRRTTWPATA